MVLRVDGVCIFNSKKKVLYWTSLTGKYEKNQLYTILEEFLEFQPEGVYHQCRNGGLAVVIKRHECYWLLTSPSSIPTPSIKDKMSLLQALEYLFSSVITTLLPTNPTEIQSDPDSSEVANVIAQNTVIIHQLVMEIMSCGVVQLQPLSRIISQITLGPKPSQPPSSSLFGVMRVPSSGGQYSSLAQQLFQEQPAQQESICVDVIEVVSGSCLTHPNKGTSLVSGEARGRVLLKCPNSCLNSAVSLTFNKLIPDRPALEGGQTVAFGSKGSLQKVCSGARVVWDGKKAECSALHQPETNMVQYCLNPSLPFILHLTALPLPHSKSDHQIEAKLSSMLPPRTMIPKVVLKLQLPPTTSFVSSRHSGPGNQQITFSAQDEACEAPSVTWTIEDLVAEAEVKAFIRVISSGKSLSISSGTLDYEISSWLSSGLKIDSLHTNPPLPHSPWVRYISVGERIRVTVEC